MRKTDSTAEDQNKSGFYEIRIKGHLDQRWAAWFEGMTLTPENNGETLIAGPVIDQAALYGLLKIIRDLGLSLVSVRQVPIEGTCSERSRMEKNENDQ
jgi:hypothetical protein